MACRTGLVLDDCFQRHDTGPGHAERPERLEAIREALVYRGLVQRCDLIDPAPVAMARVLTNHSSDYIHRIEEHCQAGKSRIDCQDSAICPESFEIAMLAAGAVCLATEAVAKGELCNAFCAVRPPGHHAERDRSMGFCLFNNVAIAARVLRQEYGLNRVLILDWDVHHGNGTQHSFEADPSVFFCSLHQHPATLYPGSGYEDERGIGAGEGMTLNLPMMPGAGDAEYRAAFRDKFLPAARAFRPEFVLISAGFDAHRADPLAQLRLESDSFKWMTQAALGLAQDCCGGRLVSVLEGGYDLQALGDSVAVHLQELIEAGAGATI